MPDAPDPPDEAEAVLFLAPEEADWSSPQALHELARENVTRTIPDRPREQTPEE
jgi:hypothetical protein